MFRLKIKTDNAAFCDQDEAAFAGEGSAAYEERQATARNTELARIVRKVAAQLADGRDSGACVDTNGNKVGEWEVSDRP